MGTTPPCFAREWGTKNTPECAPCNLERWCGPNFASTRLLEVSAKLGMARPMVSRAAEIAQAMNNEVPLEAVKTAIGWMNPNPKPAPMPQIPADFPSPPRETKRGRPKGSKNKKPVDPATDAQLARIATIPHVGAQPADDGDHPLVDTEVVEAEQLAAIAASISEEDVPPIEAAPTSTDGASEGSSDSDASTARRYTMSAPEGASDERRAQDRGWCPGRGYLWNLTTGVIEIVDWPGFPAVLRRPDSLAPVLQIVFWSVPLNKWVWLVDSPSGRQIPEGVVELTWQDMADAGVAQMQGRSAADAIRQVAGRA